MATDFGPEALLECYARGLFPMAESHDDPRVFIIDPDERAVLPLDRFRVPRRLARTLRGDPFTLRFNTAFGQVLDACAALDERRSETWINAPIRALYLELHAMGHAHSLECWQGERLAGGLYGVSLGGAFFGESMFSRVRDASKVALVHLAARLRASGFVLLDAQFENPHLDQFGPQIMSRRVYHQRLTEALRLEGDLAALARPMSGAEALDQLRQPTTQAS
ncbi:MAG: leucyl/phenylalanyl-tRNA--protein transferase [Brevundimonas sp.]|uniref:leucyl/phenylalanyl-tRNA--protein transferase n=1 Tax=Brevundimonas sp. TaxID=1871086 RepID=UPI00391A2B1A